MEKFIDTLQKYVSMPSGTLDKSDSDALAKVLAEDFSAIGMQVKLIPGRDVGAVVTCTYGHGPKQLMLMGHFDTVFPRAECQPFRVEGDIAHGSGVCDMKGGIAVMLHALSDVLPKIDQDKYSVKVVLNPDEEIGSPESGAFILQTAKESFAALSFEPARKGGGLTCERKGVTSFKLRTTGVRGHSGAAYLSCASAIQELCNKIVEIYKLRDDSRDISVNIGVISGGTAENVVADEAEAHGEFRYFDQSFKQELMDKLTAICAKPGIPKTTVSLTWGNSHPALKATEKSMALMKKAQAIGKEYGYTIEAERTGGAGDIAIAGLADIPVLDGFGLEGVGMHTTQEYAYVGDAEYHITLAKRMLMELLQ